VDESDRGKTGWFDAAYNGDRVANHLKKHGVEGRVIEQGYRNHPLNDAQKESNRMKSVPRTRVEHVFGAIEMQMGGSCTRLIGLLRNRFHGVLTALTYNILSRFRLASPCPGLSR
jgi:IS5 family transposase